MNILAIDVGNTRVALAACRGGKLVAVERLAVGEVDAKLPAAVAAMEEHITPGPPPRVVICSVNPPAAERVAAVAGEQTGWPVLFVGREVDPPIDLAVADPATVGMDRVVASAAAFDKVGGPVVTAIFGTALTINCVDGGGRFRGGVICPGLALSLRALHEGTHALPLGTAAAPETPFAGTTQQAIAAGVYFQAVGAVREVVERMATELGQWPHLVLAGGDAELIAPAYEFVDSVVPDLGLLGVNVAFRLHVERMDKR